MKAYGSVVIDCVVREDQRAFVVCAGDGDVLAQFDTCDPVADMTRARQAAADLADKVFLTSSVDEYWMCTASPTGRARS